MDKKIRLPPPLALAFLALAVLEGLWVALPAAGIHLAYWVPVSLAGLGALAAVAHFAFPRVPAGS